MFKYVGVAMALKMFSMNRASRRVYRCLGNTVGARQRVRILARIGPSALITIGSRFIQLCREYNAIQDGQHLLEIGTGWMHQWAILVRLVYDVETTLFDICDNRQIEALRLRFCHLEESAAFERVREELALDGARCQCVQRLLRGIAEASNFDELYALLNCRYVVEPNGSLSIFEGASFDGIFSINVLEHIGLGILGQTVAEYYRLLRPGGHCVHLIDLNDHLAHYDHGAHVKNYLRYSDRVWKAFFENAVQYINRIQRPEWLDLFRGAGFVVEAEKTYDFVPVEPGEVAEKYQGLDKRDLESRNLAVVLLKPGGPTFTGVPSSLN